MANPYELRFDMYNTARERLTEEYYAARQLQEGMPTSDGVEQLAFPTAEMAIAEAKEIEKFVSDPSG